MIAPINGYLNLRFTPNIAGSVIPKSADTPAADATPFNFCYFYNDKCRHAAPPCATLDIAAIGKINEPPVLLDQRLMLFQQR